MSESTDRRSPFDPVGVRWQPVSPQLVTVRLISLALALGIPLVVTVVLAAVAGVPALWGLPVVIAVAGLWAGLLIPRQVRAIGYAEREDDLLIRHGILQRVLVVVPYGRMQFVDVQAGPLDRWGGVARVQLHTASAASDAAIPGLVPAEAARLRDRLAARGEARLAGL
ncbi:MAG TPA: PH domain-containing protein [Actinotalea sp.]|nr:PH domain-containing protein [Actinotalea sp.]